MAAIGSLRWVRLVCAGSLGVESLLDAIDPQAMDAKGVAADCIKKILQNVQGGCALRCESRCRWVNRTSSMLVTA